MPSSQNLNPKGNPLTIDALLLESESERQSFDVLSEIREKVAFDLRPRGERNRPNWFTENETKCFKALERRNEAYNESTLRPIQQCPETQTLTLQKTPSKCRQKLPSNMAEQKAKRVTNKHLLNAQGGDTWQAIKEINASIKAQKVTPMEISCVPKETG
jgi:hypothetical protein